MNYIIVAIILILAHEEYMASPTPIKLPGYTQKLTPYIKHWEAANYDRTQLHAAHQRHIEQKRHRRKRDVRKGLDFGPAHTIRLQFYAHDKEFRLVLRQNPLSVFADDVHIENTHGPIEYDISRIYTGALEDDENSHVHAILTSDNLLDGTIETSSEQYYVEPAHRYSKDLLKSGVHSIVYKVSDVSMKSRDANAANNNAANAARAATTTTMPSAAEHCASERLRRSMIFDELKRRKLSNIDSSSSTARGQWLQQQQQSSSSTSSALQVDKSNNSNSSSNKNNTNSNSNTIRQRQKRWLPDELSASGDDHQNPPLPLDLEVPYNDDFTVYSHHPTNREKGAGITATTTTTTTSSSTTTTAPTTTRRTNFVRGNGADREELRESASVITWRNANDRRDDNDDQEDRFRWGDATTKATRNRNIIVNNYNPNNGDSNINSNNNNNNPNTNNQNNYNNGIRKTYTKHKNIIVSTYNNNNNNNNNHYISNNHNNHNNDNNRTTAYKRNDQIPDFADYPNDSSGSGGNNNNFFNPNWTTMFVSNDRPSHKTHVEIITKNGATKKPNIIVNNYNPEIVLAPNPHNPNFNNMLTMTNLLSGRGGHDPANMPEQSRSLYDRKITCMLYLQADHTFFQKMGSDEASIEAITRHVQRANAIYKNTDFNNDGKPDNITFMIKRIKVHNMNAIKDPTYRFPGNYGVEKFLELFSEEDYDAFCLAYMFTYRDFEMGTLGLAWTGDLKNAGGVCEKNGHYRGSLKSLNTGIVTLLNYGKHVPPAVSHVTLAHEIGHNFGSPHDPEQCTPGGEDGNYIMFARATSGDKKNNNKFSPCSLKSIEPVLNAKARSMKGCFTEPQTSICGNGVVEPGEQCDCGWEEDCKDSCCFPMSRHPRNDEQPCTLTPSAMCSPSQGPCCTTDCRLKFGDKCRDDNGCRDPSFCDGRMPQCPPSINKPNKTICNKEFVCYMGDCTGSICLAYGLESCQCIPGPQDEKIKSCELCCKLPGEDNACRSSFEWNEPPFDVPDMYAKPGTPCNDYNGYCDVFQKCREVDPSGPLATLRKLLLSEESIASFKKWMQHNWYTVALAALGVFILLILSTKLLSKRSNLKQKSVTIIHSATTETVRLPDDNNGVIVHTAVRTKVPFKKKVRGERTANNNNNSSSKAAKGGSKGGAKAKASSRPSKPTKPTHSAQVRGALAKVTSPVSAADIKKPLRTKKNPAAAAGAQPPLTATTTTAIVGGSSGAAAVVTNVTGNEKPSSSGSDPKLKAKKLKKHSKEIIDYSARNAANGGDATLPSNHTNTFGKVQKWLLESPIVAQPLSHIEHSSKVRKVMAKSQSTPERLVQKSPTKTKSMGNLANEKVKLQVVYKPPFKFSLRLSKNSKVKTHVVSNGATTTAAPGNGNGGGGGGALYKFKRQAKNKTGDARRHSGSKQRDEALGHEKAMKRTALLLRGSKDEDNQILTLSEPNYETLNPKTMAAENYYENLRPADEQREQHSAAGGLNASRMQRSSSRTNLEAGSATAAAPASAPAAAAQRAPSYSRSNSLSNNPFMVAPQRGSRKLSEGNSTNLSRNFGSTQNLINASQSNLAKSKKRSSLNLKSSLAKKDHPTNALQPTRRSSSNLNLRRDSSANSMAPPEGASPAEMSLPAPPLRRSASGQQALPTTAGNSALPRTRASSSSNNFANIPRASLNSNGSNSTTTTTSTTGAGDSSVSHLARKSMTAAAAATSHAATNSIPAAEQHRRSRSHNGLPAARGALNVFPYLTPPTPTTSAPPPARNNSHQAQPAAHSSAMLPGAERELPSELEVMVSDVENLVS